MALPLSAAADDGEEEQVIHGTDVAGYAQLPADHLSDSSSESNYGPADDLTHDIPASQAPGASFHDNGSSVAHDGGSSFHQNGRSVTDNDINQNQAGIYNRNNWCIDGIGNQESQISDASLDDSVCINVRADTQNSGVLDDNDGIQHRHINCMNVEAINICDASHNGHVVHVNGMEIHMYGQLAGLEMFDPSQHTHDSSNVDDIEDVDEYERQREEDAAMLMAKQAEEAHRSAPLPPDRCQAIKNAMQNISLGGYRPDWADKIPEEQWLNRLRRK